MGELFQLGGSFVQSRGTLSAGRAQAEALESRAQQIQQAREFEAAQLDIQSGQEKAAAQLDAKQFRRQKELVQSALQARAAGSGFSATDPSTLDQAGEIARFGLLQEQIAQFGGFARGANLTRAAQVARFSGANAARAALIQAGSVRSGARTAARATLLGGIGSAITSGIQTAAAFGGGFGGGGGSGGSIGNPRFNRSTGVGSFSGVGAGGRPIGGF